MNKRKQLAKTVAKLDRVINAMDTWDDASRVYDDTTDQLIKAKQLIKDAIEYLESVELALVVYVGAYDYEPEF